MKFNLKSLFATIALVSVLSPLSVIAAEKVETSSKSSLPVIEENFTPPEPGVPEGTTDNGDHRPKRRK